ncbi:hypothetical protein B0A55_12040 [Friedmanniomyces simplex]|uniref:Biogenesis of lysosome-related organelles complex 1 subunit 7 n=1 Tax=Friedmanniomyces simplex TaxID=329884 RepID=A0A4U0WT61_9PEZI|nr:hypothetical protein B0A55_12040 [Friedmanniomyces simplex]
MATENNGFCLPQSQYLESRIIALEGAVAGLQLQQIPYLNNRFEQVERVIGNLRELVFDAQRRVRSVVTRLDYLICGLKQDYEARYN